MKSDHKVSANLVLYTRPDCHLCDVAAAMLDDAGCRFSKKCIEADLDLIRRYGVRIPVLIRMDSGAELVWPFDREALRQFLK